MTETKKKIFFLINNLGGGGAEKVLISLLEHICNDDGYDITVQTIFDEGIYRSRIPKNIAYKTIVRNPGLTKRRIMHRVIKYLPSSLLHKLFVKGKYDIEIAFLEGASSKIISGANKKSRTIGWVHTDLKKLSRKETGFVRLKAERRCYRRFSDIVCVSGDARKAFVEKMAYEDPVKVILNPIDRRAILESGSDAGSFEKKRFTIVSVGRLERLKGYDRLIEVAGRLIGEGYDFDLLILGEGALRDALSKLVEELSLDDHVSMPGFVDNPHYVVKNCDLFVCSSHTEGLPLALSEALVLGVPIVSTECTGPAELLKNGRYGMLVESSADGLYGGIKSVLDDPDLLEELRVKAVERGELFDVKTAIDHVRKLLDGAECGDE